MNSPRYQELLERLLEGELSGAEAEELAVALKEQPELRRDLRSHLMMWEVWSQQNAPERSPDAFLNAWKTRLRVEKEEPEAFAEAMRNRIGAPDPRTEAFGFFARFLGAIRRPKGMGWAVSVLIMISAAVLWFAGARPVQAVTVLKGEAVCTACVLHESQEHAPALRVMAGPGTNIYYIDRNPTVAALQGYFCNGPTAATAEGKARTEEGRRLFQATTITIPAANRPEAQSTNAVGSVQAQGNNGAGAAIAEETLLRGEQPAPVESIRNSAGMQLKVAEENIQPTLRIVLPGHPASDRAIEVVFPEHVTVRERGNTDAKQLYLFQPGQFGERPRWRRSERSLEYEKNLPGSVHLLARATLEEDGVRFHFRLRNQSDMTYDLALAIVDPRLTSMFHDVRLERTYVHHADGFDLLASETPGRLTMPLDQWLPARCLASFTWPVPPRAVEHRDGLPHYNKSRAVDAPFIATLSKDGRWVVASFSRATGNVWSNPELTCQHVDPQAALSPGGEAVLETKILVVRGSLEDVFKTAMQQRESLK